MVILGKWNQNSVTLSIKPNCLTLSLQGKTANTVYSYDFQGRLWTAMINNISYRRGLDGKMVAKWLGANQIRERRWLSRDESICIETEAREIILSFTNALKNDSAVMDSTLSPGAWSAIDHILEFDQRRYQNDIDQYHRVYKPIGILPPDQYMAVVLQATEGCSFNTCTFCDFYRDRKFRIKSLEDFKTHLEDVRMFLGEGLSLRRTIFLGDANALVIPTPKLLPMLEAAHQVFDVEALGGIYAFLDGFSGERKTPKDYTALAQLGLKRVYIGLESGSNNLLRFLKKPGNAEDVLHAVHAIKEAGVAVGIIVLLGAGGKRYTEEHVAKTIEAINQMNLDMEDILYFSELIENEGLTYVHDAYDNDLEPLSADERILQSELIEKYLTFSQDGQTPHISRYDIREFVY